MTSFSRFFVLVAAAVLAGCASTYTLDNQVQSFSQLPSLAAPATYRFERLPSQQDPLHAKLEALADPALIGVGLQRDDANPRYSVEIGARTLPTLSPFVDPWVRYGWGWGGFGWHRRFAASYQYEPPWYHREVNVVIREIGTNRVVFESRAISDGPYYESGKVLPAMFQAAMQGFPNPPAGPRTVNVQVAG